MQYSLQTLRATVLLLVLTFITGSALAQKPYSFSPSGPVYLRAANGGQATGWLEVTNETSSPLKMWVSFIGDTSLHYAYAQWSSFTIGADSSMGLPLTYISEYGDTSVGYLRIRDSLDAPDSVFFIGMDTSTPRTWDASASVLYLGSYYQRSDSVELTLWNYTGNDITLSASLLAGSYGISSMGGDSVYIPANSTATSTFVYASSSYSSAQATARYAGGGRVVDVKLYGQKVAPPRDSLYWNWQYSFDTVVPGDTICTTVYIINPFDSGAVISAFNLPGNSAFYVTDLPSLPHYIAGHDTLAITACYIAPTGSDQRSYGYVTVTYQFPGDSARQHQIYFTGSTAACFALHPSYLVFNNVARDSSVTQSVLVVNRTSSSITVDADFDPAGGSHFEVLSSMPITIGAYDSASVYVKFTGSGSDQQYAKLIFDGGTGCGTQDLALAGYIADSNVVIDSSWIGLFANETRTLSFIGDSNHSSVTYRFYNDQNDSIKVTSISLKDGSHFTITDVAPRNPWFTLGPNGHMEITVAFDGTPGNYDDTLIIVTEDGFVALSYPIHAVISGSEVGIASLNAPHLMVTPNPSSGPMAISISNANSASFEVLDIMGKSLRRFDGEHAVLERNDLNAGTYFVRATGVGLDRKPFVMTMRIVIR